MSFFWLMCIFYFMVCPVEAMRNPFILDYAVSSGCNLSRLAIDDLTWLGMIKRSDATIGFVADAVGQVCAIQVGEKLGQEKQEVLKILSDRVVLSDGNDYRVIK